VSADRRPRGRAEILAELAGPLAARVLTRALGCEPGEAGTVRDWYEAIVAAVTALSSDGGDAATIARGETAYAQLAARLSIVIAEGDPGSLLAAAAHSAGDTLSAAELAANAAVILFGGIETTEGLIASSLLHVLSTPDGAAPLVGPDGQADAELVARAVEETLRLEPAAAMVDRYATVDTELGGAGIPAGDLVHVSLAAAGRDPAVFEDPDRFRLDPPRPARHLAFAQGPHVCLGVHLARLEARVALTRALERLPGLRADPAAPAAVRGVVFRKPPTLHVLWG
jgi:cytochrome P450